MRQFLAPIATARPPGGRATHASRAPRTGRQPLVLGPPLAQRWHGWPPIHGFGPHVAVTTGPRGGRARLRPGGPTRCGVDQRGPSCAEGAGLPRPL